MLQPWMSSTLPWSARDADRLHAVVNVWGMLGSKHPSTHCKHLVIHLLCLIVLSLATEGANQIDRGCPRVGMLGSQQPLAHCKHLTIHLRHLIVLPLAREGVRQIDRGCQPLPVVLCTVAHSGPPRICQPVFHLARESLLARLARLPSLDTLAQRRWARPAAPRHAHPDWMGDGLVTKQMKHRPSSWLTSSPRETPWFILARQQFSSTPAALLKLLKSCQSPPRGSSAYSTASDVLPPASRIPGGS